MWSRIVSFVDELNDDDEYLSDEDYKSGDTGTPSTDEVRMIKSELQKSELSFVLSNRYKEKVIKLREELRDAETSSQESIHNYNHLLQEKADEISSLSSQVQKVIRLCFCCDSVADTGERRFTEAGERVFLGVGKKDEGFIVLRALLV